MRFWALILLTLASILAISAEQCGRQAGGALCPNGLCCSEHGYCGTTSEYCTKGCQSQCKAAGSTPNPPNPTPSPGGGGGGGGGDIGSLISLSLFNEMLKHRNDASCPGKEFYRYDAFIAAAKSFNGFGTTGDVTTRKRELAAFLGQTSHETRGGGPSSPDGAYAWGYCFVREKDPPNNYCDPKWPCPPGKMYFGRGPIQLSHNYNYDLAGKAIVADLINQPDLVATNPTISFKTAIWYWMTPQWNKPSSHNVITGIWKPSDADRSAGRVPGYGVITNIINGGKECGIGPKDEVVDRIGFYKRYCDILGVGYGNNLDCYNQKPFGP